MLTVASIPAGSAAGYADYLESRTVASERGDYYLGVDGAPAEAPGRWLTPDIALERLGVAGGAVAPDELRAVMAGRRPGSDQWLRPAGADGARAGGIDLTFSAPKSVSIAWALGDADQRQVIEEAHRAAVAAAIGHVREHVPVTTRYDKAQKRSVPALARELHAAEFLHTTARGTAGEVPDPQLHSHVVITSVERLDGTVAAVRSRALFPAAREGGAHYRAHLAHGLRAAGFVVEQAGKDERYFRLVGVEPAVERAFSKRMQEVHRAAQAFRAEHGREPQRGELRALAVRTRQAKTLSTRDELDREWRATAAGHGQAALTLDAERQASGVIEWEPAVEQHLTRARASFDARELRTVALEQAAGRGLSPDAALAAADGLLNTGTVIALENDRFTTRAMRELEQQTQEGVERLARGGDRGISDAARQGGMDATAERLGHTLSAEQREAVAVLTSPARTSVLVGPAGTGKGVVIDAAAHAEQLAGRRVIGVAVAGRTAQRLGEDSPALAGRTRTIDSLLNATATGAVLDPQTTVYLDEGGMADTERLARLVAAVEQSGASLVVVGDHRQLPSVGAGGMFERLTRAAPTAELSEVRRTRDVADQAAWTALRAGEPAAAMAHYRARGALRFSEDRVRAVDAAARRYVELTATHRHEEVALMSDASNAEVDALNLRVQSLRRGELGAALADGAGGHAVHAGDRVTLTRAVPVESGPRIENGTRAVAQDADGRLALQLDGSGRTVILNPADLDAVRLAYASHVYRQQGATVERAVVVTGGWQTSRETAYVEASRARRGVEWHVARDELEADSDFSRIDILAARMRVSHAQVPSVTYDLADDRKPITRELRRGDDLGLER